MSDIADMIRNGEGKTLDFPDRIYGMLYDRCSPAIIPEIYLDRRKCAVNFIIQ